METGTLPTPALLNDLLLYNPSTGDLTWKERPLSMFKEVRHCSVWNAKNAGRKAFTTKMPRGYRYSSIFGKKLLAHRVIWAMMKGSWPVDQIDHINGDTSDNRLSNLRDVSNQQNGQNQKKSSKNKSGVMGVFWGGQLGKWHVRIGKKHVGVFDNFDDAVSARENAEIEVGYHENHGRA